MESMYQYYGYQQHNFRRWYNRQVGKVLIVLQWINDYDKDSQRQQCAYLSTMTIQYLSAISYHKANNP